MARTISRAVSYFAWAALTLLTQEETALIALYDQEPTSVAVMAVLLAKEVDALPLQTAIMVLGLGIVVAAPSIQQWHTHQAQMRTSQAYTRIALVLFRIPAESITKTTPRGTHSFQERLRILTPTGNLRYPLEQPGQDSNVSQPETITPHPLILRLHGVSFNNAFMQTENISPVSGVEISITACSIALAS